MALFLVVALQSSSEALDNVVTDKFSQSYKMESGKWIIDAPSITTSKTLADSLGITATLTFFTVPVHGYFGRAQPDLWEWLAAKSGCLSPTEPNRKHQDLIVGMR